MDLNPISTWVSALSQEDTSTGPSAYGQVAPKRPTAYVRFPPIADIRWRWHPRLMNFQLRCATEGDVPAMHRVRKSVRENRLSDHTRITEASYLPYIAAGSAWVAETQCGIAGFAAIDPQARSVWALFVRPDFEGAGIGRALHTRLLDWARDCGLKELTLSTEQSSRAAEFYSRSGWTQRSVTSDGEVTFERSIGLKCPPLSAPSGDRCPEWVESRP